MHPYIMHGSDLTSPSRPLRWPYASLVLGITGAGTEHAWLQPDQVLSGLVVTSSELGR